MASKLFITNDGVFAESQDDIRMTTLSFDGELSLITLDNIMVKVYYIVKDDQLLVYVEGVIENGQNKQLHDIFRSLVRHCSGFTVEELINNVETFVNTHESLVRNTNGYNGDCF